MSRARGAGLGRPRARSSVAAARRRREKTRRNRPDLALGDPNRRLPEPRSGGEAVGTLRDRCHERDRSHRDSRSCARDLPTFRPGDTVKVHARVVEGNRERVQVFQGVVIRRSGGGLRETFTVRKISFGVGVERTFPRALAVHREARGRPARTRPAGEALLPARSAREEGADQGAPASTTRSSRRWRPRRPPGSRRPSPRTTSSSTRSPPTAVDAATEVEAGAEAEASPRPIRGG